MTEPACERFQHVAAEFALGVLPGFERAQALAHLESCPRCRWTVTQLTITRDRILELVPEADPPAGFERLVLEGAPRPDRRARPWRLVAAGVAVAGLLAGGGWVLGRTTAPVPRTAPPAASATGGVAVDRVDMTADGRWVGQAFAYPGTPSFVYVSLDTQMSDQTGTVSLALERPDGSHVSLGTYQVRRGYGSWGASAQLDGDALRKATLVVVDATGRAIATARFGG